MIFFLTLLSYIKYWYSKLNWCSYVQMLVPNIFPPYRNYLDLNFFKLRLFYLFLFDLLYTLSLIFESLYLFLVPIVGGKIPCSLHTSTKWFHWSWCTFYFNLFDKLIGSKSKGPTNVTALLPKIGNKIDHWINFELHGLVEGLMWTQSP